MARPGSDQSPIRISGMPHRITPPMNAGLRRRIPASDRAAIDPISAPTPIAEFSQPTPASPMSRSSNAITTMSTVSAPATSVCAEKRPRRMRRRESPPTVRNPTKASDRMLWRSPPSRCAACAGASTRAMKSAETMNAAVVRKKTMSGLAAARRIPARAGPTK